MLKYSNQALIDLDDAISHIAKESKVNALNYLLRYEEKINLLKLNHIWVLSVKTSL